MTRNQDSLSDLANDIHNKGEMNETTYDSIKNLNNESNKEQVLEATEIIKKDTKIPEVKRDELIEKIQQDYIKLFNFNNCPEDYSSLKKEVKFFSGMLKYNFFLLAHRLIKIKDEQLYKNDGYNNFKEFIENELNVTKATVYKYMDIISSFGVSLARLGLDNDSVEYTKLIPIIPLLKSKNDDIPKEEIKDKFLKNIKEKSRKELREEAIQLKIQYGIIKNHNNNENDRFINLIDNFYKKIPSSLNEKETEKVKELISKLESKISI
jgi:hypothetical protein